MNSTASLDDNRTFFTDNMGTLVNQPSLSGVLYQCQSLAAELNALHPVEYPGDALVIRDVFLSIVEQAESQVIALRDPKEPLRARGFGATRRLRRISKLLQALHSYVTFLLNSLPREAPPAVQIALSDLARTHLTGEPKPVCLVIPQWDYNAECKPLMNWLANDIKLDALDPDDQFGSTSSSELMRKIWDARERRLGAGPPRPFPERVAVLSFARLDRFDTLMYPLLGHELGHFIDYQELQPLHQSSPLDEHLVSKEAMEELRTEFPYLDVASKLKPLNEVVQICIRELFADIVAIRILGFPFFVAQAEFLKSLTEWDKVLVAENGYPGIVFRLSVALNHLLRPSYVGNVRSFFQTGRVPGSDANVVFTKAQQLASEQLVVYLDTWHNRLPRPETFMPLVVGDLESRLLALAGKAIVESLPTIAKVAAAEIPDEKAARLSMTFFDRIQRLQHELPPVVPIQTEHEFAEILAAGWAYELLHGEEREALLSSASDQRSEYDKLNRLVLKAIELLAAPPAVSIPEPVVLAHVTPTIGGVLSDSVLLQRLRLPVTDPAGIDISPLGDRAVNGASVDLRLGNWFLIARRSRLTRVALRQTTDRAMLAAVGMEEIFVPFGHALLVHPGDFMLGVTLEFAALPNDLTAFVEGRSSIGRSGLIVATAAPVAPTFHGVLVLELANAGTVPIEVAPGDPIAQLVFLNTATPVTASYRGPYYCQIKPLP